MQEDATAAVKAAQKAPELTLGGHTATLEEPSPLFSIACSRTRAQIDRDGPAMSLAYGAAALWECWPEKVSFCVRPRPKKWSPGISLAEHGHAIFDAMRKATADDVARGQLMVMCQLSLNWAVSCGLTEADLREVQTFSEAPGEE